MRARTALLASLLTVLAPPAGAGLGSLGTTPIDLAGCAYAEILVKVDPDLVAPLVPSDFQVRVFPDGTATVQMGTAVCAEGRSGALTGPASFGWTSVKVLRPADPGLAGPASIGVYLYRLEHFVMPGDLYASVAEEVGAERIPATALLADVGLTTSLTIEAPGLQHRAGSVTPTPALPWPTEVTSLVQGPLRWREFGAVEGGYAILDATLVPGPEDLQGFGVIQADPDSVASPALGPLNGGLFIYGRAYQVRDGFMAFVVP